MCRVALYLWVALKIEKFGVDKALKWSLMIIILLWMFCRDSLEDDFW